VPKGVRPAGRCTIAARLPAATHDTVGVSTVKATRPYGEKARDNAGTPPSLARGGAFDFICFRGCRLC
jgi:hypothetical protein